MLRQLRIDNVALIDELIIEFYDGFSVLTGETGAGKSIIIEALNFVLGERASRDLIKSDANKAAVEAQFVLSADEPVAAVLAQQEIEADDGTLVLYRELSVSGKGVCRVNGTLVSAAVLKDIGDALVDIHGQHAHQALLNPRLHIGMLDAFAGEPVQRLLTKVQEAYRLAHAAQRQLTGAVTNAQERERRLDLLSYQMREIDAANLVDGEEETLTTQRQALQNAQAIMAALEGGAEVLSGEDSVLTRLSAMLHALESIRAYSKDYADATDKLRDIYYNLEDLSYTVRDLRSDFTFEPDTLDSIEWRLESIYTLKKKYGASIAEILQYRAQIGTEYDGLQSYEADRSALAAEYERLKSEYKELATELSTQRKHAAEKLSADLLPQLADLGMPNAQFEVAFTPIEGELAGANGIDTVEFLLSTNAGEPIKPLSKVASGGELSRIMLSFKSVLADSDHIATMVFDEIDSGISGQIGTAVARKMRQIALQHQVLCITHLPQIAAYANRQYHVYKQIENEKTSTSAVLLTPEQRISEIARIMGGTTDDAAAIAHARSLMASAADEMQ